MPFFYVIVYNEKKEDTGSYAGLFQKYGGFGVDDGASGKGWVCAGT